MGFNVGYYGLETNNKNREITSKSNKKYFDQSCHKVHKTSTY
jgi:hypothetical protein